MKKVLIIGAGPSGLVAAKEAKEAGMELTVLEKANSIGGLWRPGTGFVWDSMTTNLSKFTCMFSDFPWKDESSIFPSCQEVYQYLCDYSEHFKLQSHIHLNATVQQVERQQQNWLVAWKKNGVIYESMFESVIIASGVFSKPFTPKLHNSASFSGDITHAAYYKSADCYKGKTVMVIGSAFSGTEIAADIATKADKVIHLVPKPCWVLPRNLPVDGDITQPLDLVFYIRESRHRKLTKQLTSEVDNQLKHSYFSGICKDQQTVDALTIDPQSIDPPFVAISDNYMPMVKAGKITVMRGRLIGFDAQHALVAQFNNAGREEKDEQRHKQIKIDAIITCTGYRNDLDFLAEDLQQKINYKPEDQFQSVCLYESVFHPDLPGMAFVGMYRGPYWATMELQARWIIAVFSVQQNLPNEEKMRAGIQKEIEIRNQNPRLQFPHSDYIGMIDDLAAYLGVLPNYERIKQKNVTLYQQLWSGPTLPTHFRLEGHGKKTSLAEQQIKRVSDFMKSRQSTPQTGLKTAVTALVAGLGLYTLVKIFSGSKGSETAPSMPFSNYGTK